MLPLHTRFPCPLLVTTALGKNVSVRDNYHFLHKNTRPQYFIYHVRNIWLTIGDNGLQNSNEKFSLYLAFWIYYLVNLLTLQGMGYFEDTDRRKGRVLNGGCWVIPSITWKIGFPPIKAFVPPSNFEILSDDLLGFEVLWQAITWFLLLFKDKIVQFCNDYNEFHRLLYINNIHRRTQSRGMDIYVKTPGVLRKF